MSRRVRVAREDNVVKGPVSLEDWIQKGYTAFASYHYADAVKAFSVAVGMDRKNHKLLANRAAALCAAQAFDRALVDANSCIALMPKWPKGYLRKGEALVGLMQYVDACHAFSQGLELDPVNLALQSALKSARLTVKELKLDESKRQETDAKEPSSLDAPISASANPEADKFAVMVAWMKSHGAKLPTLYLQYYSDDYRGVHALRKIPNDEQILYVPLKLIMTSEVARASDIGQKILESGLDVRSKHSFIAAYLCQELHNPKSFWKPYMDILPAKYRNMPIFFDDKELRWLTGSFTLQKIEERKVALRKDYDDLCEAVPEFRQYTHEEFVWARLVVITRIFGMNIGNLKTDGLVPYADMLNHKRPRETRWNYANEVKGFTITSTMTLKQGAEVFDSYGRKCNSRYFVNYGFALEHNEEDNEAVLHLSVPDTGNDLYLEKAQVLRRRMVREFQVPAFYSEKTTPMFGFLRFAMATEEELAMCPVDLYAIDSLQPLTIRNERAVLQQLKRAAQVALSQFETDLKWDDDFLKRINNPQSSDAPVDSNIRNCVVMRHGEKTVLHWYIDLADRGTEYLSMPWSELRVRGAEAYRNSDAFSHYVTTVIIPLMTDE